MTVYLGKSWAVDFLACAGLGFAAACCLLALRNSINPMIDRLKSSQTKILLKLLGLAFFIGAQLAIVVFISETSDLRHQNSIYGYLFGILMVAPALASLVRLK